MPDVSDGQRSTLWRVGAYLGLVEDPRSRPRFGSRAWWRRVGWMAALGAAAGLLAALVRHVI